MESWRQISGMGLYLGCFLLSIVSALVPWVNGEVVLLSLATLARSPADLATLVLLTSAGQMTGKCMLYWAGRGVVPLRSNYAGRMVSTWKERFEQSPSKHLALVFISSTLGIPPFYVTTILAGAFRVRFGPFFVVGTCGRLLRFGLLVSVPRLALRFFH
jgi:membrane protein YqaA with SNARE-associated domain